MAHQWGQVIGYVGSGPICCHTDYRTPPRCHKPRCAFLPEKRRPSPAWRHDRARNHHCAGRGRRARALSANHLGLRTESFGQQQSRAAPTSKINRRRHRHPALAAAKVRVGGENETQLAGEPGNSLIILADEEGKRDQFHAFSSVLASASISALVPCSRLPLSS